jgi:hypothetical protein
MDPNEALKNARRALSNLRACQDSDDDGSRDAAIIEHSEGLADAFEALDGWLSQAGFLPSAWRRGCATCEPPR